MATRYQLDSKSLLASITLVSILNAKEETTSSYYSSASNSNNAVLTSISVIIPGHIREFLMHDYQRVNDCQTILFEYHLELVGNQLDPEQMMFLVVGSSRPG